MIVTWEDVFLTAVGLTKSDWVFGAFHRSEVGLFATNK
ncbi:hypothetical protein Q669_27510 [Labrenzia sp. C1B10]|nr:hypothetical protein Q669_27510 [Labrenzia sp. C1B10]ERP99013.1 hypothetical protein Q675_15090 [Labrenzia sp. C1B70]